MIKPRTQTFKVKVMLIKLEAVNNRVATRCHASLKLGTVSPTQTAKNSSSKQVLHNLNSDYSVGTYIKSPRELMFELVRKLLI